MRQNTVSQDIAITKIRDKNAEINKVFVISRIVQGFHSLKGCNNLPTTARRLEAV